MQVIDIQEKKTKMNMNLPYVWILVENYGIYRNIRKSDPLSTLKT